MSDLPLLWKGLIDPPDYPYFLEILSHFGIAYLIPRNTPFLTHSSDTNTPLASLLSALAPRVEYQDLKGSMNDTSVADLSCVTSGASLLDQKPLDDMRLFVPCRLTACKSDVIFKGVWEISNEHSGRTQGDMSDDEEVCVFDEESDEEDDGIRKTPEKLQSSDEKSKLKDTEIPPEASYVTFGRRFTCSFLPKTFFSRLTVQILRPHVWRLLYAWGDQRKELAGIVIEKTEKIEIHEHNAMNKVEARDGQYLATLRFDVEILPSGNCLQLLGRSSKFARQALLSHMNLLQDSLIEFLNTTKYCGQVSFFDSINRFFC